MKSTEKCSLSLAYATFLVMILVAYVVSQFYMPPIKIHVQDAPFTLEISHSGYISIHQQQVGWNILPSTSFPSEFQTSVSLPFSLSAVSVCCQNQHGMNVCSNHRARQSSITVSVTHADRSWWIAMNNGTTQYGCRMDLINCASNGIKVISAELEKIDIPGLCPGN
jgi:hypothetical protein